MFPWNVEVLVWLDGRLCVEVVGMAQGPTQSGHLQKADWAVVERFALDKDFPNHQLVIRPQDLDDPRLIKGIAGQACPACSKPGYWTTKHIGGLPCGVCKQPTRTYMSQEWACVSCTHRHVERRTDRSFAERQHCERCNR
jgi:hypothetical protein